jgi:hypothetical protein
MLETVPIGEKKGSEPLKIPADQLQTKMGELMKQLPPNVRNSFAAAMWLLEVDAIRKLESELLANGTYDQFVEDYRRTLSSVIAMGEDVVFRVKRIGMVEFGPTLADLQATLNSLHATFRGEYGPHNSQKTNELISQLLNGAQRED